MQVVRRIACVWLVVLAWVACFSAAEGVPAACEDSRRIKLEVCQDQGSTEACASAMRLHQLLCRASAEDVGEAANLAHFSKLEKKVNKFFRDGFGAGVASVSKKATGANTAKTPAAKVPLASFTSRKSFAGLGFGRFGECEHTADPAGCRSKKFRQELYATNPRCVWQRALMPEVGVKKWYAQFFQVMLNTLTNLISLAVPTTDANGKSAKLPSRACCTAVMAGNNDWTKQGQNLCCNSGTGKGKNAAWPGNGTKTCREICQAQAGNKKRSGYSTRACQRQYCMGKGGINTKMCVIGGGHPGVSHTIQPKLGEGKHWIGSLKKHARRIEKKYSRIEKNVLGERAGVRAGVWRRRRRGRGFVGGLKHRVSKAAKAVKSKLKGRMIGLAKKLITKLLRKFRLKFLIPTVKQLLTCYLAKKCKAKHELKRVLKELSRNLAVYAWARTKFVLPFLMKMMQKPFVAFQCIAKLLNGIWPADYYSVVRPHLLTNGEVADLSGFVQDASQNATQHQDALKGRGVFKTKPVSTCAHATAEGKKCKPKGKLKMGEGPLILNLTQVEKSSINVNELSSRRWSSLKKQCSMQFVMDFMWCANKPCVHGGAMLMKPITTKLIDGPTDPKAAAEYETKCRKWFVVHDAFLRGILGISASIQVADLLGIVDVETQRYAICHYQPGRKLSRNGYGTCHTTAKCRKGNKNPKKGGDQCRGIKFC